MVGRNDPCPCGSGKKYKKCCMKKEQQSVEKLVEQDLKLVFDSFFETALENPKDMAEFEKLERSWVSELSKYSETDDIRDQAAEYFLFIRRPDLWKRHLMKMMNKPIRPATQVALEDWMQPFVLYAEVSDVYESKIQMKEILGDGTYYFHNDPDARQVLKGDLIFGIVFPDNRELEDGIFIVQSLSFFNGEDAVLRKDIENLAAESEAASSAVFFQENMLALYKMMGERELAWDKEIENEDPAQNIEEYLEADLRPLEREVMERLYKTLDPLQLPKNRLDFIKLIAVSYFANVQPDFRKPEIVAAAIFKAAYDFDVFPDNQFSQAEIAKMFHTSVASMMKHANKILDNMEALQAMK